MSSPPQPTWLPGSWLNTTSPSSLISLSRLMASFPWESAGAYRRVSRQLLAKMNAFLAAETKNGDIAQLQKKWLTPQNSLK